MKYERKFYTEEAAVWKAAESSIEKLELHRSAAQKAKDQLTNTLEAERIMNKAEEQLNSQSHVIDLGKTKHFVTIHSRFLKHAKYPEFFLW